MSVVCPHCGRKIILTAEKEATPVSKLTQKEVKAVFGSGIEILEFGDGFVEFSMTGKYNKKRFSKLLAEVQGYKGTFVKSRFRVPLVSIGLSETE